MMQKKNGFDQKVRVMPKRKNMTYSIRYQKTFRLSLVFTLGLFLNACASFQQQGDYPAAPALDKSMTRMAPTVDLSKYQSVQSPTGRPWQRDDMAVVVAASGGGYRASNLAVGVLMGMEEYQHPALKGRLLDEVDYFSTVSGGGFGVGAYIASLHRYLMLHPEATSLQDFSFSSIFQQSVSGDTPALRENAQRNTLNATNFITRPRLTAEYTTEIIKNIFKAQLVAGVHRGEILEGQLEDDIFRPMAQDSEKVLTLGDLFVPADGDPKQVKMPYWITNATIFQNGAIFPFAPDILAKYKVIGYRYDQQNQKLQGNFNEPRFGYELPLVSGMRASANFPIALPPTTFVSSGCEAACYLQLLDGGLTDNLGINTALQLLEHDEAPIKLLIIIDAYRDNFNPYSQKGERPTNTDILVRISDIGMDSSRNRMKPQLPIIATELLCARGAEKVLTVYLDIDNYPEARAIQTSLDMTPEQQQLLLKIGKEVVEENRSKLDAFFSTNSGKCSIG